MLLLLGISMHDLVYENQCICMKIIIRNANDLPKLAVYNLQVHK